MPVVRYTFTASGHRSVRAAFESIGAAAEKAGVSAQKVSVQQQHSLQGQARQTRAYGNVEAARVRQRTQAMRDLARMDHQQARARTQLELTGIRQSEARRTAAHRAGQKRSIEAQREHHRSLARRERAELAAQRRMTSASRRRAGGFGFLRRVGSVATAMGTGAAIGFAGAAARETMDVQDLARTLSTKAAQPGAARVAPGVLEQEARGVAGRTPGVKATSVLRGATEIVTLTGNLDLARRSMGLLAEFSVATGTSIEELAQVVASLTTTTEVESIEQLRDVIATLAVQGKRGSFELSDMATRLPKILAIGQFFDKTAEGVKQIGGLLQIAKTGYSPGKQGAAQLATGFENFLTDLTRSKVIADLKGRGIDIRPGGKPQSLKETILNTAATTGGDLVEVGKIFKNIRGKRFLFPFMGKFQEFLGQTGDVSKALRELDSYIDDTTQAYGAQTIIQQDLVAQQQSNSAKLTTAWERLTTAFAGEAGGGLSSALDTIIQNAPALGVSLGILAGTATMLVVAFGELVAWVQKLTGVYDRPEARLARAETAETGARAKLKALEQDPERQRLLGRAARGTATEDEQTELVRMSERITAAAGGARAAKRDRERQEKLVEERDLDRDAESIVSGKFTADEPRRQEAVERLRKRAERLGVGGVAGESTLAVPKLLATGDVEAFKQHLLLAVSAIRSLTTESGKAAGKLDELSTAARPTIFGVPIPFL